MPKTTTRARVTAKSETRADQERRIARMELQRSIWVEKQIQALARKLSRAVKATDDRLAKLTITIAGWRPGGRRTAEPPPVGPVARAIDDGSGGTGAYRRDVAVNE